MPPPLVLLDLDNTLVDRESAFREWARRFCADHELAADNTAWLEKLDEDGLRPREDFARAACERLGRAVSAESMVSHYERVYPASFTVPDATLTALRALRSAGHRLAIVTNGPPFQEAVVDQSNLREHVDAVCVSAVVGFRKPDPRMFHLAAERAGVPLDPSSWMIGDSPSADIEGARLAGIRSIWIHRDRPWDAAIPAPDLVTDSFENAVRLVLGSH